MITRSSRRGLTALGLSILLGAALSSCGTPDATASRIERSLAPTFANLYIQRAGILGETGVTTTSIAASATCDRGGPTVPDVGPGSDWVCMISYNDDQNQNQSGKFELQVHTDSTYVAAGPSQLIGPATLTNRAGVEVPNPVFGFDGTFDPNS